MINLYISYLLNSWLRNLNAQFTLNNCLFGSLKLTKNTDLDKYKLLFRIFIYRWKRREKNVIIFGAGMSSTVYTDNKNKDILILGEGPTQALADTRLTAEANYSINFTPPNKGFLLSL